MGFFGHYPGFHHGYLSYFFGYCFGVSFQGLKYLTHVSDGEITKECEGGESLENHWFLVDKLNHGGILGFDADGEFFSDGTYTLVNLGSDLSELAIRLHHH